MQLYARIIFCVVLLGPLASLAEGPPGNCDDLLGPKQSGIEAEVVEYLKTNAPPKINHRRLGVELKKLSQDLLPIRQKAGAILQNEIDYAYGKITREEAVSRSQSERHALGQMAQNLLQQENLTVSEHHQLEGLRVLLDRTRRVEKLSREEIAQDIEKDSSPADATDAGEQNDNVDKQESSDPKENADKNKDPNQQKDQPSSKDAKNSKPSQPKPDRLKDAKQALNKHRERQPKNSSEKPSDSDKPKDSDPSDANENPEDEDEQKPSEKGSKPQAKPNSESKSDPKQEPKSKPNPNPKSKSEPKEGQDEKSDSDDSGDPQDNESQEGKPKDAKPEAGKPQNSDPQSGDPQSGDPQSGEPKDGEPADGEGQKGEAQGEGEGEGEAKGEGESDAQGEGEGEGQADGEPSDSEGKPSDKKPSSGKPSEAKGGDQAGSEAGDQSLLDNFNQFFKDKLKELRESTEKPKLTMPESTSEEGNTDDAAQDSNDLKRQKDKFDPPKLSDSKIPQKPKTTPKSLGGQGKPLPKDAKMSDTQFSNLTHSLIRQLMATTLRNYRNSDAFKMSLGHLQTTLSAMAAESSDDAVKQFASTAKSIRESLNAYQVDYKNLEGLGLSLMRTFDGGGGESLRKIHFVNEALTSLATYSTLTAEEARVHELTRRIISAVTEGRDPSDKDFCMAFLNQLIGPLAKRVLLDPYKVESSKEGFDFTAMAKAIRNGEYNDLLVYSRLAPYMNMLLATSMKPKTRNVPSADKVTINEHEPEFELAQELDNFQRFYRDGSPINIDLIRFISGDMLEEIYRDEKPKNDPHEVKPKKVSFILYDVSGSMGGEKELLRNALMLAYLDHSQKEVLAGRSEHVVYLMAFDSRPHEPERVGSLAEAHQTFARFRGHATSSGGGTDITDTLVDAYRRIAEKQDEGGELNRANILLLTDAEDSINFPAVEEAKNKIAPSVDVRLNGISLGNMNPAMDELIEMQGGEGGGKLGRVVHQHISHAEISNLLDQTTTLSIFNKSTQAFNSASQNQIDNSNVMDLKNKLVMLDSRRSVADNAKLSTFQSLERAINTEGQSEAQTQVTAAYQVFKRLAMTSVSTGWTRAEKLENLWDYIQDMAREMGSEPERVLDSLSENQKQTIRQWLG